MITFKAKTQNDVLVRSTFSPMQYPAGETHIVMDHKIGIRSHEIAIVQFSPESLHTDLFLLEMWLQTISSSVSGVKRTVIMPYLPGARSDRGIPTGAASYAWFMGHLNITHLITLDPHSPAWLKMYRETKEVAGYGENEYKITVLNPEHIIPENTYEKYDGIIAPDKGAVVRANEVAAISNLPLYTALKERDFETGRLNKFIPPTNLPAGDYLIVDDICDGGGTFMGLSHAIRTEYPDVTLDLYVSHGVFSGQAVQRLPKYFHTTYTTTSFNPEQSLPTANFEVIDVIPKLLNAAD